MAARKKKSKGLGHAKSKHAKPKHTKHAKAKHTKHAKPKHAKHAGAHGAHRKHAKPASEHPVVYHVPGTSGAHHSTAHHTAHHAPHHPPHTPATEWDRLWHAYIESNRSGSLMDQIRAGRALLRFDKVHGTPPLPHLVTKLREAHELLVKHGEAFAEAQKLDRELRAAERSVKRHAKRSKAVRGIVERSERAKPPSPRGLHHSRRPRKGLLALPRL